MTEKAPERIWGGGRGLPGYITDGPVRGVYDVEYVRADIHQALTAERDALAADNKRIRLEVAHANDTADAANEAARQAHILVSERDARLDALAAEVERLREAILGATFMDSQKGTVHAAKQDWVDLAELWPVLAEVHSAALEEGKDG